MVACKTLSSLLLLAVAHVASAERREFVLNLKDVLVDTKRPHPCPDLPAPAHYKPGHCTQEPCERVAEENRHAGQLINGCYPGPTIDVNEGDEVVVTVVNAVQLFIVWHINVYIFYQTGRFKMILNYYRAKKVDEWSSDSSALAR
jgi:FtsP/CotA-like multicopper oxidase with cupredoxin domain